MKRGRPEDQGHRPGEALRPRGRARRFATPMGELWRLPVDLEVAADRLLTLGRAGLGGFVEGGRDAQGPWLVRHGPGRTLEMTMADRRGPRPWREVVEIGAAMADTMAEAERMSLFPGPLRPRGVSLASDDRVVLHADRLIDTLVGHAIADTSAAGADFSRWSPPEQAAGAPWDNAANRYVLGLLLYRMLAGEHPFSGKGLRLGLADQARRGAPPLPDPVAASLPPGLQSSVLRLLAAEAGDRPSSAAAIAERLRALLRSQPTPPHGDDGRTRPVEPAPEYARQLPPRRPTRSGGRRRRWAHALVGLLPVVGGLGLFAVLDPGVTPPPSVRPSISIGRVRPLDAEHTSVDDCATCHPRQAAQWHGSVMAHSVKSPLFQALEILIEEQVGRDFDCPEGAGVLRPADGRTACRDRDSGLPVTGSGGELWCVNCHAPGENLQRAVPAWDGRTRASGSRRPLVDLLPPATMEGISCAFCHQTHGPVRPGNGAAGLYEGNPSWTSTRTGALFSMRPEDARGRPGIANSGYLIDVTELLGNESAARAIDAGVHLRPTNEARAYLGSSRFCGACHDVRLFGTDAIGVRRGEHFKRLRNAYSEWTDWAERERRAGREPASCQDCHMSAFPGVCVPVSGAAEGGLEETFGALAGASALRQACPEGTRFEARAPGTRVQGAVATSSSGSLGVSTHYFSGVDVPLSPAFPEPLVDDPGLDVHGIPRGAQQRRDMLLGRTFSFELDAPRRAGGRLELPVVIENVGAGHKVPAGFSQEREIWVHLRVSDRQGDVLYEVGRVERGDEDLRDKVFVRLNVDDGFTDAQGRPQGVFGADVVDGPDVPRWSPPPDTGARTFRGEGLINLQNGFLRCVRCIGEIDPRGRCQPLAGQRRSRAARYEDGAYDPDTGACISNLTGPEKFFETYFPVGALDATRGVTKGPDAIIDTRSAAPGVPLRYVYDLPIGRSEGALRIEARLLFRAFPPFLVRAFAAYEAHQAAKGRRPSGPLVTNEMLERLDVVELHRIEIEVP